MNRPEIASRATQSQELAKYDRASSVARLPATASALIKQDWSDHFESITHRWSNSCPHMLQD